jgi:hypothetical protein
MIGICRHLGESAFTQEPLGANAYSVHRQSRAVRDDTKTNRVRSYVLVTAELDEVEDVFCLGQVERRHALATLARAVSTLPASVLWLPTIFFPCHGIELILIRLCPS